MGCLSGQRRRKAKTGRLVDDDSTYLTIYVFSVVGGDLCRCGCILPLFLAQEGTGVAKSDRERLGGLVIVLWILPCAGGARGVQAVLALWFKG